MLDAAAEAGVERFVNISTDKAADPVNVLGLTKRLGEMLTSHYGATLERPYMSVRFGNVLGSQGSVIPIFREQLERGETLTITDPAVTRFFMTLEEAVQLVVQAGAIGSGGDVMVLDMGEPIPIVELARRLAAEITPGQAPEIEYTGLRPGEKLHETLVSNDDIDKGRPHELLLCYRVPSITPEDPDALLAHGGGDATDRGHDEDGRVDPLRDLERGGSLSAPNRCADERNKCPTVSASTPQVGPHGSTLQVVEVYFQLRTQQVLDVVALGSSAIGDRGHLLPFVEEASRAGDTRAHGQGLELPRRCRSERSRGPRAGGPPATSGR